MLGDNESSRRVRAVTSQKMSHFLETLFSRSRLGGKAVKHTMADIHGVRLMKQSVESMADSLGRIAKLMECLIQELQQINSSLGGIQEELRKQNILISQGATGQDGFARVVHNFVKMHIRKNKHKGDKFFLWNPDTSWHPAFYDLLARDPLPTSFCGESDNLDLLCIAMMALRLAMRSKCQSSEDVVFHLLIPSYEDIKPPDPLHFPDEILPLRIVGQKYGGGHALVGLNLPHAQHKLELDGVENTFGSIQLERKTTDEFCQMARMTGIFGTTIMFPPLGFGLMALEVISNALTEPPTEPPARILGSLCTVKSNQITA